LRSLTRLSLFITAAIGLVLTFLSDFVKLSPSASAICSRTGSVLFFIAIFAVTRSKQGSEETRLSATIATAVFCFLASCLYLASALVLTPHWLHGLMSIAAVGLFFYFWLSRPSGWTALASLPIYAIILMRMKWRMFPELLKIPLWIWIAMSLAWVLVTLLVFRWIDKRHPNASPQA
jgi:hypothetical protein